ncbi:MAG: hypothetical protein J5995_09070 [Muribaculaceae bacterium]|nr:hypothetical protein [Muribaculaceae bacterium]
MNKSWKSEQLDKIAAQIAVFRHIPEEIGNVLYCDTNQPNSEPLSPIVAKRKKIIAVIVCALVLILYWIFLYNHYIWGGIITILAIIITGMVSDSTFSGSDYFVGDKGFATVSFWGTRDNIISVNILLFKDIEYFFTGECINKMNYTYNNTSYYFSIYGKLDESTNQYNNIFFSEGAYDDKRPTDAFNPKGANEEYCMLKIVEKIWTSFFVLSHASDDKVNFDLINDEVINSDAITISRNEINVYGTLYNSSNTKRIYTSNGNLVIEHINHSKKLFGFIENGDISSIPLSSLGNRQAFLIFFDRLYNGL